MEYLGFWVTRKCVSTTNKKVKFIMNINIPKKNCITSW